jgi:hypothetical protein
MPDTSLATQLIETLPVGLPGLFNPWQDHCPHDANTNGPVEKRERLGRHLDCDPTLILVGEAPGYQGCRYSGIAFTSERLLIEGVIPRIPALPQRLSTRRLPFSEPSATIVWKTLFRLGIAERTILWNALQLHPLTGLVTRLSHDMISAIKPKYPDDSVSASWGDMVCSPNSKPRMIPVMDHYGRLSRRLDPLLLAYDNCVFYSVWLNPIDRGGK